MGGNIGEVGVLSAKRSEFWVLICWKGVKGLKGSKGLKVIQLMAV